MNSLSFVIRRCIEKVACPKQETHLNVDYAKLLKG